MCYDCYKKYGKPAIVNGKTLRAAKLTEMVYKFASSGGLCHIVIDDFNLDDDDVEFCLTNIKNKENGDEFTEEEYAIQQECMEAYLELTINERASALAIYEGWIDAGINNQTIKE